jgi:hypothetical protein
MAVYHGARPRAAILAPRALPDRSARTPTSDPDALPRRRTRTTTRAGQRPNRIGLLLGGIVITFLLAFFSLAQTVRVSATGYDINRLLVERDQLEAQRQELLSDLSRLGREPAIRKQALDLGLGQLIEPLIVTAR